MRPHLEFAVQAWSPHLHGDIAKLEKIQRRATKLITTLKGRKYPERLKALDLTTLKQRRTRGDLLQQYKIENGHEIVNFCEPPKRAGGIGRTRGHSQRLTAETVKNCEERRWFFSNRVVAPWNALSEQALQAQSVNAFKNELDKKA